MRNLYFTKRGGISFSFGFTLAEVLVTIGIIGIIAALTIPSLIAQTQDTEYLIKWKKIFSVITQITDQINADNELMDFSLAVGQSRFRGYYETRLNAVKKTQARFLFAPSYAYYKNTSNSVGYSASSAPALMLADGTVIFFNSLINSCTSVVAAETNLCGYMLIDINGTNGPNMYGKDMFQLFIQRKNGYYITLSAGEGGMAALYKCIPGSANFNNSLGCAAEALGRSNAADMP